MSEALVPEAVFLLGSGQVVVAVKEDALCLVNERSFSQLESHSLGETSKETSIIKTHVGEIVSFVELKGKSAPTGCRQRQVVTGKRTLAL